VVAKDLFVWALRLRHILTICLYCASPNFFSYMVVYIDQARMTDEAEDCILVAPSGLSCDEVTASSLVKLSPSGAVIDAGTTGLDVDALSLSLHSALYMSPRRSDVKSIMHITSTNAVLVRMLPNEDYQSLLTYVLTF